MRRTPVPLLDGRAMYTMALDPGTPLAQRLRLIASLVFHPYAPGCQDDLFQQYVLEAADRLDGNGPGEVLAPQSQGPIVPPPVEKALSPTAYQAIDAVRKAGGDVFYHYASNTLVAIGSGDLANTILDLYKERKNIAVLFQEMTDFSKESIQDIDQAIKMYREQFNVAPNALVYKIPCNDTAQTQ